MNEEKTTKQISEELLEEFKELIKSIDSEDTQEVFTSCSRGPWASMDSDLITAKLYRIAEQYTNRDRVFLCDMDPLNPLSETEIGKRYGGGHYICEIRFYIRKIDAEDPEAKKLFTKKLARISLGSEWDREKKINDEASDLNQFSIYKQLQKQVLGSEKEESNVSLIETMKFQNEMILKLLESKAPHNNYDPMASMASLLGALAPLLVPVVQSMLNKPADPLVSVLLPEFKNLISANRTRKEPDIFEQVERFKMLKELISDEPAQQENKNSNIEKFMSDFLPALGGIAEKLLSPMASRFPNQVTKRLDPYRNEIELINSDPEIKARAIQEMKKNGLNEEEIMTVGKRAGIDLDFTENYKQNESEMMVV